MNTVLHVVPSLRAADGGPSRSVPALCRHLGDAGWPGRVLAAGRADDLTEEAAALGDRLVLVADPGGLRRALPGLCDGARLVHVHGVWHPLCHAACAAARAAGIPYAVSPRGMLEPWALGHHAWRKRLAWLLYQGRDLRRAALLHATAPSEEASLRRILPRSRIAVAPNGVDPPPEGAGAVARTRKILFLGRIHPKKGIDLLLAAVAANAAVLRSAGWRVVAAGPDDGGHLAGYRNQARSAGISDLVAFPGQVDGRQRWQELASAAVLCLPTRSENFGMVVAEALACGTPVITTTAAPWEDLARHGCGWWVAPDADAIAGALGAAVAEDLPGLARRGSAATRLVRSAYTWPAAARRLADGYALIGCRP